MVISYLEVDSDLIQCEQYDSVYIVTSDYIFGQIILVIIEINQLLPHLIIPVALVIVTARAKRKRSMLVIVILYLSKDTSGS